MFERFTERARQIVVLAQEEARERGDKYITSEHLFNGIVLESEGLAARVLEQLGLQKIEYTFPKGSVPITGLIPFTAQAKKVLELALREALSLGHNYIGTEHLLLGLTREAPEIFSVSVEEIRKEVMRMLSPSFFKEKKPKEEEVKEEEKPEEKDLIILFIDLVVTGLNALADHLEKK